MDQAASALALDSDLGASLIAEANIADPLRSAESLRRKFPTASPALVSAALTQRGLASRATARFGELANTILWTADGLEQASRPAVSQYRARRLRALGSQSAVDLTCGLGLDAIAMARAGIQVVAVDRDPNLAKLAAVNARRCGVGNRLQTMVGDCTDPALLADLPRQTWFVDPARRRTDAPRRFDGSHHRLDDPERWSPAWSWVREQRRQVSLLVAKTAPGIDHSELAGATAEWISHDGDLVEATAWWGGAGLTSRSAIVLRGDGIFQLQAHGSALPVLGPPAAGSLLIDPDPAIVRSGLVTDFGALIGAGLVDEHLAFLTTSEAPDPDVWRAGRVYQVLHSGPYDKKGLRSICANRNITRVEVTGRGRRLDADRIKKELRLPGGSGEAATLVTMGLGPQRRTWVALVQPAPRR